MLGLYLIWRFLSLCGIEGQGEVWPVLLVQVHPAYELTISHHREFKNSALSCFLSFHPSFPGMKGTEGLGTSGDVVTFLN